MSVCVAFAAAVFVSAIWQLLLKRLCTLFHIIIWNTAICTYKSSSCYIEQGIFYFHVIFCAWFRFSYFFFIRFFVCTVVHLLFWKWNLLCGTVSKIVENYITNIISYPSLSISITFAFYIKYLITFSFCSKQPTCTYIRHPPPPLPPSSSHYIIVLFACRRSTPPSSDNHILMPYHSVFSHSHNKTHKIIFPNEILFTIF